LDEDERGVATTDTPSGAPKKLFFQTHEASLKQRCSITTPAGAEIFGDQMAVVAKVLSNAFPETKFDVEILKVVAIFSGVGLAISLICASYGLDLSPGFF
jgi:hypothetical protein